MSADFSIDGDGSKYCARVRRPGNIPHLDYDHFDDNVCDHDFLKNKLIIIETMFIPVSSNRT